MLVRILNLTDHIADLKEAFSVLKSYKMKLNPPKLLGVISIKFLGFMAMS